MTGRAGDTTTRVAIPTAPTPALDVAPIRLSRVERGLDFNNVLAHRADTWLTQNAA